MSQKRRPSIVRRIIGKLKRLLVKELIHEIHATPYFYGQSEIRIGQHAGLGNTIFNARSGKIIIHDNVIFGHNCIVVTGIHDPDVIGEFRPTLTDAGRDVEIGRNVFVGSGAIIVGGPIRIGDNAVIGAGAVVVKDVPPGVLVAGSPARVIRQVGPQTTPN